MWRLSTPPVNNHHPHVVLSCRSVFPSRSNWIAGECNIETILTSAESYNWSSEHYLNWDHNLFLGRTAKGALKILVILNSGPGLTTSVHAHCRSLGAQTSSMCVCFVKMCNLEVFIILSGHRWIVKTMITIIRNGVQLILRAAWRSGICWHCFAFTLPVAGVDFVDE